MYKEFGIGGAGGGFDQGHRAGTAVAQTGEFGALPALDRIGTRRNFARDEEIFAEGEPCECWYKVVSGTVRIFKLLIDGRRHIAKFCFAGDCFGLDGSGEWEYSAEAVGDVVVMRFPRRATERLIDETPLLARSLCHITLRELAQAQNHMLLLGRMTAPERVASFLRELSERRDTPRAVDLPMSRNDIADYLGLTIETVCRVLSGFKREGMIAIPSPHRIELLDLDALETVGEG
jgi:CRP/FNR family nitrogen fixation transcriptional regulator